jgi:transcription elongation factor GreA
MKFPMTPDGYAKLKEELRECRAERPRLGLVIEEAREHGDIKENAEFHAAKEKQAFLEGRIRALDAKIGQADVIDPSKLSGDKVVFGATVTLADVETDEEMVYMIVGDEEADPKQGRISIGAPVARALIGREVGDEVKVKVPGGMKTFEVMDVAFG